jgi:dTDP-4-amino-4,6-dideoxygalactose transaminase
MIPFNKPFFVGNEIANIKKSFSSGKISGDGVNSIKCHNFFRDKYGFKHNYLTTSCTDALEMAAILLNLNHEDEVIIPSYTFVSTANPFVLRGAKIKFVDSQISHPNIDHTQIEGLITKKTKAIVIVHYAGVACDIDYILKICRKYSLALVEDCAHSIGSYYKNKPLGSFGLMSAFSFHETKNISAGEGGLLVVNNEKLCTRAEIIREKGTNRTAFFRGDVAKYTWVDIGSSFLPSDIISAVLYSQLQNIEKIQKRRVDIFNRYNKNLSENLNLKGILTPITPEFATNNGHMFYLICRNKQETANLIKFLRDNKIHAVKHYVSLHSSKFFKAKHDGRNLKNSDRFSDCLVRLPFFFELSNKEIDFISSKVIAFFN